MAMKDILLTTIMLGAWVTSAAEEGWWMREPIRWVQTNLRETDAALDPKQLIDQVAAFDANVLLVQLGGISAFYPSQVQYHYVSPYLPKGHDTFGEVLKEAHARGIRIIGRFDLSKTHKDAFDAHPEWFFKKANGEPAIYNGLYQVCVNGGWYREQASEILKEALENYDVDGLFFNMFSNPSSDYSGNPLGLCQCGNCRRLYRARFHRDLPLKPDREYQEFLREATQTMSEAIRALLKAKRPKAALVGTTAPDMVFSESNTAVRRPLPLWPYASSDNVNRARNIWPERMAINQCMSFIDFPWRFGMVPQPEIRTRLWQNVANGGAAAINVHGTLEQQDRTALETARPIFAWLKQHSNYYVGQLPAARVLLLGLHSAEAAHRGLFRMLSEQHLPFGVVDNLGWMGRRPVDLVISTGETPKELDPWIRDGGRLIIASSSAPLLPVAETVKLWKEPDGAYFRVRDKSLFPSLRSTDVIFMYGDYLEVKGNGPLTFIPPSMYGPPELVHIDWKDTSAPGLVIKDYGKGKVAWLPWNIGALYYLHSSEAHARLMRDLIDQMLPQGRQLKTDAHPLIAITLMLQGDHHLVHFVNLSGHSQTGYFDSLPVRDVRVQVKGTFHTARTVRSAMDLAIAREGEYTSFTLPSLEEYELVELR